MVVGRVPGVPVPVERAAGATADSDSVAAGTGAAVGLAVMGVPDAGTKVVGTDCPGVKESELAGAGVDEARSGNVAVGAGEVAGTAVAVLGSSASGVSESEVDAAARAGAGDEAVATVEVGAGVCGGTTGAVASGVGAFADEAGGGINTVSFCGVSDNVTPSPGVPKVADSSPVARSERSDSPCLKELTVEFRFSFKSSCTRVAWSDRVSNFDSTLACIAVAVSAMEACAVATEDSS